MPIETWVYIVYELAAIFHRWKAYHQTLISMMVPIYLGQVASFVNKTKDMDSTETEALVEEQAVAFEEMKDYLIKRWEDKQINIDAEATLANS